MKKRKGYDETQNLRIRGLEGILAGRQCILRLGETVFVGRSQDCDLHPAPGGNGDADLLKKMSRRHVRVSFCNTRHIEIEDVSRNGTFLNGKRIDRVVLQEVMTEPAVLDVLGGTIVLESAEGSSDITSQG